MEERNGVISMSMLYTFQLRLDQRTRDILTRAAAADQKTDKPNCSQYIRTLILSRSGSMTEELAIELHQLRNQVSRIGNNLNQLARVANQTGNVQDAEMIQKEIGRLYEAFEDVKNGIEKKTGQKKNDTSAGTKE